MKVHHHHTQCRSHLNIPFIYANLSSILLRIITDWFCQLALMSSKFSPQQSIYRQQRAINMVPWDNWLIKGAFEVVSLAREHTSKYSRLGTYAILSHPLTRGSQIKRTLQQALQLQIETNNPITPHPQSSVPFSKRQIILHVKNIILALRRLSEPDRITFGFALSPSYWSFFKCDLVHGSSKWNAPTIWEMSWQNKRKPKTFSGELN